MSNALTVAILGFAYASLFLLERARPLRRPKERLLPRLLINIAISLTAFAAAAALVRPATAAALDFTQIKSFGLLPLASVSGTVEVLAAFLLLDLSFYYWHVANHRMPFLWRFHNVHHIDPDLDVSTALRFHVGEVLLSAGFRALQVSLIGLPPLTYMIYEGVFQASTLFQHSNIRLPLQVERLLNRVLVTPRMHGIHHSVVAGETNSNYSVVFS